MGFDLRINSVLSLSRPCTADSILIIMIKIIIIKNSYFAPFGGPNIIGVVVVIGMILLTDMDWSFNSSPIVFTVYYYYYRV